MGNSAGTFTDQDPLVLGAQIITARSTVKTDLNTIINENDVTRATNTFLNSQSVGNSSAGASQVSAVAQVAAQTVGAGQSSGEITDGGQPCHIPITAIALPLGHTFIERITVNDMVLSFDDTTGERVPDLVIATFQHRVDEWLKVTFADGHSSGVDKEGTHKYWTQDGQYRAIIDLDSVWRWVNGVWIPRKIIEKTVVKEQIILYNFTTEKYHNYEANSNACSNSKREPGFQDGLEN